MPISPVWLLHAMDKALEAIAGEPFDSVLPARVSVCGIAHAHTAAPDCLDLEMEVFIEWVHDDGEADCARTV